MARFNPQKFNINDINGGERFENGQKPQQDAFNAPIEGSAYAIEIADQAITKADQALNSIIPSGGNYPPLTAFPIGSVYISTNEVSPAVLFGGSWEKITDKFLVGAGNLYALGTTSGSADAIIPQHYHNGIYYNAIADDRRVGWHSNTSDGNYYLQPSYGVGSAGIDNFVSGNAVSRSTNTDTVWDGTNKNLPPYLAVNIWKRTA